MKRFLFILVGILVLTGMVYAGDAVEFVVLELENIATNGATASTETTEGRVMGYVEGVFIDVSEYDTGTATVAIVTSASGLLGVSRTILSSTNVVDDCYVSIRLPTHATDGSFQNPTGDAMIPLKGELITLTAEEVSSTMTTNSVRITLFLKK